MKLALDVHKSHGAGLGTNFAKLWEILVSCAKSRDSGEIICVLDGLDECEEKSRTLLLNVLKDSFQEDGLISGPSVKLKVLITSRPVDKLEMVFNELIRSGRYFHLDGDEKSGQIKMEINKFIEYKVKLLAKHLTVRDRALISKLLMEKENRTYLWLYMIFFEIEQNPSVYRRSEDIEHLVSETPLDVWEGYEKTLERCKDRIKAELLLQLVLAATRPLTLDEANLSLTLALSRERYSSHQVLKSKAWSQAIFASVARNLCGLLIMVYDEKLFFIHQTVREFLTAISSSPNTWQGRFKLENSHGLLAQSCLQYLLFPDFARPIEAEHIINDWYPFYQYAADNWISHFSLQDKESANSFLKEAQNLCDESIPESRTWMEMYNGINKWNIKGTHVLNVASFLGLEEVIDGILMCDGSDSVNLKDADGWTPLLCASAVGEKAVVEKLLNVKELDVNSNNKAGQTALMLATTFGQMSIIDYLVGAKGLNVNAQDHAQDWTALMYAVDRGEKTIVEKLLTAEGIDVGLKDENGRDALNQAVDKEDGEIIAVLVAATDEKTKSAWPRDFEEKLHVDSKNVGLSSIIFCPLLQ
jgi:hypothetical protein